MIAPHRIVVMALALIVGACAYESSGITTTTLGDPNALPPATGPADLVFEDQLTEGSTVIVASVSLPADGFVALHADEAGAPGAVIGVGERLSAGVIGNVSVPLFVPIEDEVVVHAMVHIDMDRDGVFTFEPPDGFVDAPATRANGETAAASATVALLPALTPADVVFEAQRSLGIEIVVAEVLLPAAGFVVLRADEAGAPGGIVGAGELLAEGSHTGVVVELDDRLEISATLWAQLVIDRNGNRTLDLEGLDAADSGDAVALRVDGFDAADSAPITAVARAPAVIQVSEQESEGIEVTVDSITLPSGGFVVVLADAGGSPGDPLVVGDLLERGTHREVALPLDPSIEIPAVVWIELHIDFSGDGAFGEGDVIARFEGGAPARASLSLVEPTDDENGS